MTAGRELWLEGRYRERGVFEPWTVQWQMIGDWAGRGALLARVCGARAFTGN